MSDLISIIIPVFNKERNLQQCVDSILAQSYIKFRLLLIDDCSTDSSGSICEKYAEKDKRIEYYKNERNSGPGYTRNRGITLASGKYLMFVDADDYLEKNTLEELVKVTEAHPEAGAVLYGYQMFDKNGKIDGFIPVKQHINDKEQMQRFLCKWGTNPIFGSPCNKLFNLKLVTSNGTSFPLDQTWAEDFVFNLRYFSKYNDVVVLSDTYYNYRRGIQSLTTNYKSNKTDMQRFKEVVDDVSDEYLRFMDGCQEEDKYYWLQTFYLNLIRMASYNLKTTDLKKYISELVNSDKYMNIALNAAISNRNTRLGKIQLIMLRNNRISLLANSEICQTALISFLRKIKVR